MASVLLATSACKPQDGGQSGDSTGANTTSEDTGSGTAGTPSGCGDGTVVAPEACDDGNRIDGDGCNNDCQISGSMVWCKAEIGDDGPGGGNLGRAVALDDEGNAIVVGTAYNVALDDDQAIAVKYSSDGELQWKQVLPDAARAVGVVRRGDDTIIVATANRLFHLTATGDIMHSSAGFEEFVFDDNGLAISSSGALAFAANVFGLEPRAVIGTVDNDLAVRWTRTVDDLAANTQAMAISPDLGHNWLLGGTVVVETIDHGDTGIQEITEGFLRKYDADGALLWSQRIPAPVENYGYVLTAIRPGEANEAVILGYPSNTGLDSPNIVFTTVDADGHVAAHAIPTNTEKAVFGWDLVLAPGGSRILAGWRVPADGSPSSAFVSSHVASGELQWSFDGTKIADWGVGFTAVQRDATGHVFVVGSQAMEKATDDRVLVCKLRH